MKIENEGSWNNLLKFSIKKKNKFVPILKKVFEKEGFVKRRDREAKSNRKLIMRKCWIILVEMNLF